MYIVRRILLLGLILFGMSIFIFLLTHMIPADPARVAAGQDATVEMVQKIRMEMGLDKPLLIQYYRYVRDLLHGNFGNSIMSRKPIIDELLNHFPATIELSLFSIFFTVVLGIPLGIFSATRRGSIIDHVSRIISLSGMILPVFWVGLMLQLIFYKTLGIFPFGGRISMTAQLPPHITGMFLFDSLLNGNFSSFLDCLHHIILPGLVLSNVSLAIVSRVTRSSMLEVLSKDYIRTARAKGLPEYKVIYVHALKNAGLSIITVVGLRLGALIAGAVVTEAVFAWPGIGSYIFKAIGNMDYPALIGATLVISFLFASINFLIDILYLLIDPRIKY